MNVACKVCVFVFVILLWITQLLCLSSSPEKTAIRSRRQILGLMGTKPPGTTCRFNPCQSGAQFCKNGGTCILNEDTCRFSCICLPEYSGDTCKNIVTKTDSHLTTTSSVSTRQETSIKIVSTMSTVSLRPLADRMCSSSVVCTYGFCRHEEGLCVCDSGYTGHLCESTLALSGESSTDNGAMVSSTESDSSITTLRDLDSRTCLPGFVCTHGVCVVGTLKCVCDDGWSGAFCDEQACPKLCGLNADCVIRSTGNVCVDKTTTAPTTFQKSTTSAPAKFAHACNANYFKHALEERQCLQTYVCEYGVCNKEALECTCDDGATGHFCENKCCFDCGDRGQCSVFQNGTEYCECDWGISGRFCNETLNVCQNNNTLRALSERQCSPGFVCEYGYCKEGFFKCVCDEGVIGDFCEGRCCLDCGVHGVCASMNMTEYCNCEWEWTGQSCEVRKPEPITGVPVADRWYWWLVGACVTVLVMLLIVAVALPYWMWRRRAIIVMKIVHYFQPYEDDDSRRWDAFISYKADEVDERFVVHTLYPMLEKEMGFKLCVHFRDFTVGETIANNIIDAVQNSRRTIMVLTPRFVQSEFTRFEYQVAQHEMLERKHKIIPVILEDISELEPTMDENLKVILNSVTYLEYPQDENEKKLEKFWKRLQLSLPKKRSEVPSDASDNNTTQPVYSIADSSSGSDVKQSPPKQNLSSGDSIGGDDKSHIEASSMANGHLNNGNISNGVIIKPNDIAIEMTNSPTEINESPSQKQDFSNHTLPRKIDKYFERLESSA